jgi:mRNA interferase RelE/StbE
VSRPPWTVSFTRRADRDLDRLDHSVRPRVIEAIERLAAEDPRADVRRLSGSNELRLRVGDWRVRFRRDHSRRQLVIQRVLPRGRAYRD